MAGTFITEEINASAVMYSEERLNFGLETVKSRRFKARTKKNATINEIYLETLLS